MKNENTVTIALDGTGGDNLDVKSIASSVRFALVFCPNLRIKVYGTQQLNSALAAEKIDSKRYEFYEAPECIPQDESPRAVLEGYRVSAMRKAIEAVKNGEADLVVSSGGTGPLVTLARHILGSIEGLRPALCAKIPAGPNKYSLMLDLGANASSTPEDLRDFALLGQIAYKALYNVSSPRVCLLNVGSERNKGSVLIKNARDLIEKDRNISFYGFVESDKMFTNNADVIVTDGFTGNVALKAAEGVANIFLSVDGLKKFFSRFSRPDWLQPWQYNGSILLGVDGLVIKSHASAGKEAVAVALVEATKTAQLGIVEAIRKESHS